MTIRISRMHRILSAGSIALLLAVITAATAAATARVDRAGGPFFDLLSGGRDAGRFDRVTAALYTLYAVRAPERLPADLREARARTTGICATPALVVLEHAYGRLPEQFRAEIDRLRVRPVSAGYVQSAILPMRVHWEDAGQIELAMAYLARFEESWLAQVNAMGFTAPPPDQGIGGSDDFDVYLNSAMGPGDGYSDADVPVPETWWFDMTSFIVISANTDEPSRRALVAHEFNHSCQWAMDAAEDDAFYENTSSFVEDAVYDEVDDIYWYLPMFQDFPQKSLDYFGELYQYGAFPWQAMLVEHYGDGTTALIRDLWNLSRQAGTVNEPDYFDVLDTVMLPAYGTDLRGFYTRFAQWRWFTGENDDGRHFSEHYPEPVAVDRTILAYQVPTGPLGPLAQPAEFGANYIVFLPGQAGDLRVTLNATALKAWSMSLIGIPLNGDPAEVVEVPVANGYGRGTITQWERFARVVLVVCNLGDGNHDPDADDWATTGYLYSAERLAGSDVPEPADARPAALRLDGPSVVAAGGTAVRLALADGEAATLGVHDAAGRLVRLLWSGEGPRLQPVVWDGRDGGGLAVPAGMYGVVLRRAGGEPAALRVVRLR